MNSLSLNNFSVVVFPEIFKFLPNQEMNRFVHLDMKFEYARLYDLFQASQVCKQWEKSTWPAFRQAYQETYTENIPEDGQSDRLRYVDACRIFNRAWPFDFANPDAHKLAVAVDQGYTQRAKFFIKEKNVNPFTLLSCLEFPDIDVNLDYQNGGGF